MTTNNYLHIEEHEHSKIIKCNQFTKTSDLLDCLSSITNNIDDLIDKEYKGEYTITINNYEGIMLLIFNYPSKCINYCLIDGDIKKLKVNNSGKEINYQDSSNNITNENLDNEINTKLVVNFINYLRRLDDIIPFKLDSVILCNNLRIFNEENYKIIESNDEFILALPNFYQESLHKMVLNIISKKDLKIIGSIECYFSKEDNLQYRGNFSINLYKEYQNMDYEKRILKLFKDYVNASSEDISKVLYLAGTLNDELIDDIALEYGGVLAYQGDVPKSDPLNFMGKVRQVKIYRIG
jgi:hypothetical protein